MPLCPHLTITLIITQLNSTQLTTPKEKSGLQEERSIKAYINPRFFSKQSRCFLKVATVSQLINDTGKPGTDQSLN